MSSTNKTTHYELSQYVSSDKPTYLTDYNGDMLKIDTGINAAKTTADSASTAATNAATAASSAQTTANTAVTNAATAQSTADTANTNIGTLANLTTTEKTSLVGAINEVNAKSEVVDSMSGTDTNKAPSVHSVKEYLDGTSLYYNATGTTGNVVLSESISNYSFIEIYYISSDNEGSIKLDTGFVTKFTIHDPFIYNGGYYDRMSAYTISGNTITYTGCVTINNFVQQTGGNAEIKIIEVVGYKY